MMHSCIYQNYTVFFHGHCSHRIEKVIWILERQTNTIFHLYIALRNGIGLVNTHTHYPTTHRRASKLLSPFHKFYFYMTYICLNVSRTVIVKCICISHDFFALPLKADRYSSPRQTGTCHSWHQHHHAVQGFKSTTFIFRIVQSSWLSACIIWYSQISDCLGLRLNFLHQEHDVKGNMHLRLL